MLSQLSDLLDNNHVKYTTIEHTPTYTALETAQSTHIHGMEMAKPVMLKVDGELAMMVLPASYRVDLDDLREALGATRVELAGEHEFKDRFPGCETGAMPPFGNLYGVRTLMAGCMAQDEYIAFNGGTHTEVIQMKFDDFRNLTKPEVLAKGFKPRGMTPPRMKEHRGLYH